MSDRFTAIGTGPSDCVGIEGSVRDRINITLGLSEARSERIGPSILRSWGEASKMGDEYILALGSLCAHSNPECPWLT